jgi:hypothetical protein
VEKITVPPRPAPETLAAIGLLFDVALRATVARGIAQNKAAHEERLRLQDIADAECRRLGIDPDVD